MVNTKKSPHSLWWLALIQGILIVIVFTLPFFDSKTTQIEILRIQAGLLGLSWLISGGVHFWHISIDGGNPIGKLVFGFISILTGGIALTSSIFSGLIPAQAFLPVLIICGVIHGITTLIALIDNHSANPVIQGVMEISIAVILTLDIILPGKSLNLLQFAVVLGLICGVLMIVYAMDQYVLLRANQSETARSTSLSSFNRLVQGFWAVLWLIVFIVVAFVSVITTYFLVYSRAYRLEVDPKNDQQSLSEKAIAEKMPSGPRYVDILTCLTPSADGDQHCTLVLKIATNALGQAFFVIGLATVFPISYFAYDRNKRPSREKRLKIDLALLGVADEPVGIGSPVRTTSKSIDELVSQALDYKRFILFVLISFIAALYGSNLLLSGLLSKPLSNIPVDAQLIQAVAFGFLGAYLYCLYLIYRRYTTTDLQPSVYFQCTITIIMAVVLNYVAFRLILNTASSDTNKKLDGLAAVIAFSFGFFQMLGFSWLRRITYTALGITEPRSDALSLSRVEGISPMHEQRLNDNGIDDIQNLVSADIPNLLINSAFNAKQVIDWVDQSLLMLHIDASVYPIFRKAHIRTLSGFRAQWQNIADDTQKTAFAGQLQTNTNILQNLYNATYSALNSHVVENYYLGEKRYAFISQNHGGKTAMQHLAEAYARIGVSPFDATDLDFYESALNDSDYLISGDQCYQLGYAAETLSKSTAADKTLTDAQKKNLRRANQWYKKTLKVDPQNRLAHNGLAWLYATRRSDLANGVMPANTNFIAEAERHIKHVFNSITMDSVMFNDTQARIWIEKAKICLKLRTPDPVEALRLLDAAEKSLQESQWKRPQHSSSPEWLQKHRDMISEIKIKYKL